MIPWIAVRVVFSHIKNELNGPFLEKAKEEHRANTGHNGVIEVCMEEGFAINRSKE